jgi:hypothetical protein
VVAALVVGAWLALVAVIWLHRPSRHLAAAALRLLPDVLHMLRALVADPATPRRERWLLIGPSGSSFRRARRTARRRHAPVSFRPR